MGDEDLDSGLFSLRADGKRIVQQWRREVESYLPATAGLSSLRELQ